MQDTVVEEGAVVENLITDKEVTVTAGHEVKGSDSGEYYFTVDELNKYDIEIFRTDTMGTIIAQTDGESLEITDKNKSIESN